MTNPHGARYRNGAWVLALAAFIHSSVACGRDREQRPVLEPLKASGIYEVGEDVGWTVRRAADSAADRYAYTVKKNNFELIASGELDLEAGPAEIRVRSDEPAMLYLEVAPVSAAGGSTAVAGAAVAPTELQPVVPPPDDFEAFWRKKIAALQRVPENAVIKRGDSGRGDVRYATIRLDHMEGHIHGQMALPARPGKYPALLILQWASPPYPLEKAWVVDRAAEGWLALNIQPHDVLPTAPRSYYDELPERLKRYEQIGSDDRDTSYFLRMYLADYRAVDYLVNHPSWDGRTLVVMGTSMGGQQGLCVAGLHPRVTHLIVNVPAGCDLNAPLHGRQGGYPFFPSDAPGVMAAARYFDAVNFAKNIRAKSLVAMGFVDTVCPPAGIWTAFNQIAGPKEAVPMVDSPHNHQATPEQQAPFTRRSAEWLDTLVKGGDVLQGKRIVIQSAAGPSLDAPRRGAISERRRSDAASDDRQRMLDRLGIKRLRPGADPNQQSTFDEATADRYADSMPDALTMNDGTRVRTIDQWRLRRQEDLEAFAREVYGRVPADVPPVAWEVRATSRGESGGVATVTRELVGRVENSRYPELEVNIAASFTVPAEATTPVPVMISFEGGFGRRRGAAGMRRDGAPWTEEAIARGWGHGWIDPTSIQPDEDRLREGIVGLTNRGGPRDPDEWGALRAWAWGVSRLVDYFEQHAESQVDASKVGIEGLSRYGKAALVAHAFDERIAVALIASSGQGGTKLHRRVFGEAVENLAGGFHYWMAGNYLKYAAAEPERTAADLPVDSHQLIASCAPRPCLVSYGTVAGGDPPWVDARGSFMACVLAAPAYELFGAKGPGAGGDYRSEPMPPVGELVGGELAWRQHEGGHTVGPNWPVFFQWVSRYIQASPRDEVGIAKQQYPNGPPRADEPAPRTDANSKKAHQDLLKKARLGATTAQIDVYFVGDSITRRWGCTDPQYGDLLEHWKETFHGRNAANFAWGGDSTSNILWRLKHGELKGLEPKVFVILAGTNNLSGQLDESDAAEIARGIKAIVDTCRRKVPSARIVLMGIFPRNDRPGANRVIDRVNALISKYADGERVRYLNINAELADAEGKLRREVTNDGLHLTRRGYEIWAAKLTPILTEWLGPPAASDEAPPPTGDPSVVRE